MRRTSRIQPLGRAFGLLLLLAAISGCEDNAPIFQSAGNNMGIIDCQFPPAMSAMRSHPSQTPIVAAFLPLPKAIESQLNLKALPSGQNYIYTIEVSPSDPDHNNILQRKTVAMFNLVQPILTPMGGDMFWVPEDKYDYVMDSMEAKGYLGFPSTSSSELGILAPAVSRGAVHSIRSQ